MMKKTEFMVIAPKHLKSFMSPVSLVVVGTTILPADSVRNLGVTYALTNVHIHVGV